MQSTQLSINELIMIGVIVGGVVGLLLGLVPFALGRRHNNRRLGLIGLLATFVGGLILSALLALPTAAIFSWIIIRKAKVDAALAASSGAQHEA